VNRLVGVLVLGRFRSVRSGPTARSARMGSRCRPRHAVATWASP